MTRIAIPESTDDAPEAARNNLDAVGEMLGSVPNMFRAFSVAPAALEGYLSLNNALSKGRLAGPTRERIALAVAQANGCDYCLAAHSFLGAKQKLSEEEMAKNRHGGSADPKADAAVRFASTIVAERGSVSAQALEQVKNAGYSDEEVIEIVAHVALNTLTNYLNETIKTDVDFPEAQPLAA